MDKSPEAIIIEAQKKEIEELREVLKNTRSEMYAHLANCDMLICYNNKYITALEQIAQTDNLGTAREIAENARPKRTTTA